LTGDLLAMPGSAGGRLVRTERPKQGEYMTTDGDSTFCRELLAFYGEDGPAANGYLREQLLA
jgi:hypothetical protein